MTKIIDAPYLLYESLEKISKILGDNIFKTVSTFCYLFYYNKFIGLAFLVCILLICILTYFYIDICNKLVYKSQVKYDDLHEYIEDTMSNLISIYSNNQDKVEIKNYEKENKLNEELETSIELCELKYRIIYSILYVVFFALINYLTIQLYINNDFKLSILISIIIINYGLLNELMYLFYNIKVNIHGLSRIQVLSDYIDDIDSNYKNKINTNNKI